MLLKEIDELNAQKYKIQSELQAVLEQLSKLKSENEQLQNNFQEQIQ